jgi:hypothetical protein
MYFRELYKTPNISFRVETNETYDIITTGVNKTREDCLMEKLTVNHRGQIPLNSEFCVDIVDVPEDRTVVDLWLTRQSDEAACFIATLKKRRLHEEDWINVIEEEKLRSMMADM